MRLWRETQASTTILDTMDIFISWHGKRSHAAAEALRGWLPLIVNAFKPWLSSADIDKGARWGTELSNQLGRATAGIFCLTPSNLTAPWLIFEAGAISRTPEKTYVCTLLVDLQSSDVTGPLSQFQATRATKEEIHQLVKNLNKALGEQSMDDAIVGRAFEMWWPELEKALRNLPPDETTLPPRRTDRELLEELVDLARATMANQDAEERAAHLAAQLGDIQARLAVELEASRREIEVSRLRTVEEMRRAEAAGRDLQLDGQDKISRLLERIREEMQTQARAGRAAQPPTGTDGGKS
jgi:hypothetical protein